MPKTSAVSVLMLVLALLCVSCSSSEQPQVEQDTSMHYIATDSFVMVNNTPYGSQGAVLTVPANATDDQIFGIDLKEGKIKILYTKKGVESVVVDGENVPRKEVEPPPAEGEEAETAEK